MVGQAWINSVKWDPRPPSYQICPLWPPPCCSQEVRSLLVHKCRVAPNQIISTKRSGPSKVLNSYSHFLTMNYPLIFQNKKCIPREPGKADDPILSNLCECWQLQHHSVITVMLCKSQQTSTQDQKPPRKHCYFMTFMGLNNSLNFSGIGLWLRQNPE